MDDKELGLGRPISRRQFCQGAAVGIGASLSGWALAGEFAGSPEIGSGYYPPALTGLRGAHPGSFEAAHAVVFSAQRWSPAEHTGEGPFDLVVVGAGISGLAAAYFYQRERPGARILILDNHDDFGGHAKRNEFNAAGRTLIGYGGSQSIENPSSYSPQAKRLLKELAIDLEVFEDAFDTGFYRRHGLQKATFLDRATFGCERLVLGDPLWSFGSPGDPEQWSQFATQVTKNKQDARVLMEILAGIADPWPGVSGAEKFTHLRKLSYADYLRAHADASEYLLKLINSLPKPIWGLGADAISAREAMYLGLPGFGALSIDPSRDDPYAPADYDEPYIFHFPDGNAGIARLLVRKLVPRVAPGAGMQDMVTASYDYRTLDQPQNPVKVRLNATAVEIAHHGDPVSASQVAVTYVKAGQAHRVRARNVIYAGYSAMLAHIAPEFPKAQANAFETLVKVPLLYANVLLRNWVSFASLGVNSIRYPGGLMDRAMLDFPVSLGDYQFARNPADPIIVHLAYVPTAPNQGLDNRAQHLAGQRRMLAMSFEDYERAIRSQMAAALAGGGFDPAQDILGITVNRWPHGYAYEYNDLYDPPQWNRYRGPHVEARKPFGRVSVAGSDAEAYAYVNGAVDSAWRAVSERL